MVSNRRGQDHLIDLVIEDICLKKTGQTLTANLLSLAL